MTLTITAQPLTGPRIADAQTPWLVPAVVLNVTSTSTGTTAVPDNSLISVIRIHPNNTRHRVLTEQGPRLAGGVWTWLDIHCPYNGPIYYEVTADNGVVATSAVVWLLSDRAYLIHPSKADWAVRVDTVASIGDRTNASRSAQFVPIGGQDVFLTDGYRDGVAGNLEVRTTAAGQYFYWRLFNDDQVVLLNTPNTAGWELGWMWLQPGDITYTNPAEKNAYPYRYIKIPYRQAADPIVILEPAWSSQDALAYWTTASGLTSADMVSRYATSLDFLTDTRL